jgi:predicted nucleotidyltransferase
MNAPVTVPKNYAQDIDRAVQILKAEGCSEIFLFGSAARGQLHENSDLDLAVRGCPRGHFFSLVGRLLIELERPVDLVDLDRQSAFAQYLKQEGMLVQIA